MDGFNLGARRVTLAGLLELSIVDCGLRALRWGSSAGSAPQRLRLSPTRESDRSAVALRSGPPPGRQAMRFHRTGAARQPVALTQLSHFEAAIPAFNTGKGESLHYTTDYPNTGIAIVRKTG